MNWKKEWLPLTAMVGLFLGFYFIPFESFGMDNPVNEGLLLTQWYAREHVLLCLVPAFFIAGAISVFVSQGSVMKYLGPGANRFLAYGVASISGSVLAVCSCTVLPLFAGIYGMGAGLGPASAFLYSGPAINVLAIILTARVLGPELGLARAVGAILFAVIIGLLMHLMFFRSEARKAANMVLPDAEPSRPLWKTVVFFALMIGILVSATWGKAEQDVGLWSAIYSLKWIITGGLAVLFAVILVKWFSMPVLPIGSVGAITAGLALAVPQHPVLSFSAGAFGLSVIMSRSKGEAGEWFAQTWGFAKQILPLLLIGVLVAGMLLGRPGHEGFIPSRWVGAAVGGNSLGANLFASVAGAFMYFATLTEIPILQGLLGGGMGNGPALALLLAGPALSLPSMLVIRSVIGMKKTLAYVSLVIIMATITGIAYGLIS
ncbi:MAG TPA: permease [candidate division Zixibacteria bacterium]|nr:permease [candidate division Zixibacteria bacterium]